MNPRWFAFWLSACLPFVSFAADGRPNVLMIAVDDLNDWVEPLGGHPDAQTPNMARLARQGLTFTNAHCQSPLCNSSRCSLMLSMRPGTTGIYGLGPFYKKTEFADRESLNQCFRRQGYETYTAGKIYHGQFGRGPEQFDHVGPPGVPGVTPPKKLVPPTPAGNNPWVDWGVFEHDEADKGDHRVATWCVDQLGKLPEDKPFFMACGFFLPHVPCHVPPSWWDRFDHDALRLPVHDGSDRKNCSPFSWYLHWQLPEPRMSWLDHHDQHRNLVHAYLACTTFADAQIGRVLNALEATGRADNTIICLWSDHGWHLGEKNITGKNSLWERSTHVPMIFAGPGIPAGATSGSPAELLDVYPTLADLAGLDTPGDLEGLSLRPKIDDPNRIRERPATTDHNPGNQGIRGERYRLIHYADGSEELYDVLDDPTESNNLIGDDRYAAEADTLRRYLRDDMAGLIAGSHSRVLEHTDAGWVWQGKVIDPDHPPMSIEPNDPKDLPR